MTQLQKFILALAIIMPPVSVSANEDILPPVAALQEEQRKYQPMQGEEILPDVKIHTKSNPERILLAHYKLSKSEPDIGNMAKLSPRVERAQDIDKSAMTISEYNRMNNRFNLLNPKEPIVVYTSLDLDEYSSLQNLIVFDELNDKTFFKFPVYGENIAIVPKDIEKFNRISISKERANTMFEDLSGSQSIEAEFILVPEYADHKQPFIHEETEYWLMLARIVEIRLWADTNKESLKLSWYYRDPTYKPADNQNLGGLYSKE